MLNKEIFNNALKELENVKTSHAIRLLLNLFRVRQREVNKRGKDDRINTN